MHGRLQHPQQQVLLPWTLTVQQGLQGVPSKQSQMGSCCCCCSSSKQRKRSWCTAGPGRLCVSPCSGCCLSQVGTENAGLLFKSKLCE